MSRFQLLQRPPELYSKPSSARTRPRKTGDQPSRGVQTGHLKGMSSAPQICAG